MPKKLSPTQQEVMDAMRQHGGDLIRCVGGFWTYPGCPSSKTDWPTGLPIPDRFWATGTIKALVDRGEVIVIERTRWDKPQRIRLPSSEAPMHTQRIGMTAFHFNADLSGPVRVVDQATGQTVEVPYVALQNFVQTREREKAILAVADEQDADGVGPKRPNECLVVSYGVQYEFGVAIPVAWVMPDIWPMSDRLTKWCEANCKGKFAMPVVCLWEFAFRSDAEAFLAYALTQDPTKAAVPA